MAATPKTKHYRMFFKKWVAVGMYLIPGCSTE